MTDKQKQYYYDMAKKDRLIFLNYDNKTHGMITYFIGNGNPEKYLNRDSWTVIDDESETGNVCYIDQLLTSKEYSNRIVSLSVWKDVKKYIKYKYPLVNTVRWNRWNNNRLNQRIGRIK